MKASLIYIVSSLLAIGACTPENSAAENKDKVRTEVSDKQGYSIKGMVSCNGVPVEGVVISDGVHFATTDFEGHYWLKSTVDEDMVWMSIPSGYEAGVRNGWEPCFWYGIDHSKIVDGQVQQFDFELSKVDNNAFRLMVMTDIHIRGQHENIGEQVIDSLQFLSEVRPCIQNWCAENRAGRSYAIVLGDMVQDSYIPKNNTGLPQYKSLLKDMGLTMFHIPGNHEYEKGTFDAAQTDPENRSIKKYYRTHMGPSYYSFTLGKVHFVMLDGTVMTGSKSSQYEDRISPKQLEWLRGNLLRVFDKNREDVPEKLVICCHQPFFDNTSKAESTYGCVQNRSDVLKLLSDCNIKELTVLSGHKHYSEIVNNISVNSVKVNQYTHTSACGAFWIEDYNWDDSPNGWAEYEFDGVSFTRRQRGFKQELDVQVLVHDNYVDEEGKRSLVINVPAYESGWSVKVQKGLGQAEELSQVKMKAPKYTAFYESVKDSYTGKHGITPREVWHHFIYPLTDLNAEYTVVVKEKDGRVHTEKLNIDNQ